MFRQAGFNPRLRRLGILGFFYRPGWKFARVAEMIRFRSGDLAWYGRGGISWGTSKNLGIRSLISPPIEAWGAASSQLR